MQYMCRNVIFIIIFFLRFLFVCLFVCFMQDNYITVYSLCVLSLSMAYKSNYKVLYARIRKHSRCKTGSCQLGERL